MVRSIATWPKSLKKNHLTSDSNLKSKFDYNDKTHGNHWYDGSRLHAMAENDKLIKGNSLHNHSTAI